MDDVQIRSYGLSAFLEPWVSFFVFLVDLSRKFNALPFSCLQYILPYLFAWLVLAVIYQRADTNLSIRNEINSQQPA